MQRDTYLERVERLPQTPAMAAYMEALRRARKHGSLYKTDAEVLALTNRDMDEYKRALDDSQRAWEQLGQDERDTLDEIARSFGVKIVR